MTSLRILSNIALKIITQKKGFADRINEVLNIIGNHLQVSRVYIFRDNEDGMATSNIYEWCKKGIDTQINYLQNIPYTTIPSWKPMLEEKGIIFSEDISKLPEDLQDILAPQGIKSLLVFPLNVEQKISGFIGFDENIIHRKWSAEEKDLLKTISGIISNAYSLEIKEEALRDYSEMLEKRVAERTKELRDSLEKLSKAQNKMIEQEKLASVGLLAAGVAHEINNPTGYIISNIQTLGEYFSIYNALMEAQEKYDGTNHDEVCQLIQNIKDEENFDEVQTDITDLLKDSLAGAQRIKNIVVGLQNFSQPENEDYSRVQLNQVVEDSLYVVWNKLKYKSKVSRDLQKVPDILGNANQLEQVVVHLLLNAADAIHDEGTISITLYQSSKNIVLEVKDSGEGIERKYMKKIFDPFFSTREVDEGTGLGLSIAHGIIQKHQGSIEVESEQGKGSLFRLIFPVMDKETSENH